MSLHGSLSASLVLARINELDSDREIFDLFIPQVAPGQVDGPALPLIVSFWQGQPYQVDSLGTCQDLWLWGECDFNFRREEDKII